MEALQKAVKQEETDDFFKNEVSEEFFKKLPFWINILGGLLIGKCYLAGKPRTTALVTFRELLEWLAEKTALDITLIERSLRPTLNKLSKKGLIVALTVEEARNKGIPVSNDAKKVYGLSGIGEELLRFVNPYIHFFPKEEMIVPVSFNKANKTLSLFLSRKKSFSLSAIKKICIVRRFGKTTLVFKKLDLETSYKIFPELPQVGIKEFIEYLKAVDIPLTDEIMQVLEQAFGQNEKVEWKEIAYVFQNHQKGRG